MTEEEIKKARDNYNRIITNRNIFKKFNRSAKEELEELEKDPKVQRYIFLRDTMDFYGYQDVGYTTDYDKEKIVNVAFENIAKNTIDSKKIYVFMGFFDRRENITAEKDKIDSVKFTDLETLDIVYIPYTEYETFKENNKVIPLNNEYQLHNMMYYEHRLFEIRNELFNNLIDNDQETSIQKILKK